LLRRYEGGFQTDKKHGQGKLKYANGSVYEGGWKKNKKDGHGCMTYVEREEQEPLFEPRRHVLGASLLS
jgi:hypothetical protein